MKEDKQMICTAICNALRITSAAGSPENNALKELRYIQKSNGDEIVRPVFENGTGEDGYYDINISGDSGIAIFMDVVKQFVRKVW